MLSIFQKPKGGCSTLILEPLFIQATCTDSQLNSTKCMDVVPPKTVARLFCKTGYRRPYHYIADTITCQANGQWNQPIERCYAVCGEITNGEPYITGGRVTTISNAPWHVGIYEKKSEKYIQTCGGTIISEKVSEWLTLILSF